MMKIQPMLLLAGLLAAMAALNCGTDDEENEGIVLPDNVSDMASNYRAIVEASYTDSIDAAVDMKTAIEAFLADPSQATLDSARQAWIDAREPYLQTEVYRFYEGPIDNADDGPEGLINAWPLDENYIDYTEESEDGIIQGDGEIDAETLEGLNEEGGDANIATGYHAIEFLLWGQDLSETGPGDRPFTDFIVDEEDNAERRRTYLLVVTDQLIENLTRVRDAWLEDGDTYGADFVAAESKSQLERVMTGMVVLTGFETGKERLQPALENFSQEDEHSCFSDNTHRDMILDVQGVINVWEGSYGSISGVGVQDVIHELDADLADSITHALDDALAKAHLLEVNKPFDNLIMSGNSEGNQIVQDLIDALFTAENLLEDAFQIAELTVPVSE